MPAREIAEYIKEEIASSKILKSIDIAGPGFLNLTLSDCTLQGVLPEIKKLDKDFGKAKAAKEKLLLEFVSANPTGPLHVGHGRWAVIGDVLGNLLGAIGYKVKREFYINDVGNQIDLLTRSVEAAIEGKPVPEGGYGGAYVKEIGDHLKDKKGRSDFQRLLIDHILKNQKVTLEKLGIKFDSWVSESSLHKSGLVQKVIENLKSKNRTFMEKGALWFKSQEFGDDKNRVLIKEDGTPTYFAADIAYHSDKFRRGFDRLINVWGTDHHGYVARILAALRSLNLPSDRLEIIIGQLVSLYRGRQQVRMSKRTGEIIALEEVVEEIGHDATRFFLVMLSPNTHLDFDLELAKKKSHENPVYYVQYAHARISSILSEGESRGFKKKDIGRRVNLSLLDKKEERNLMKKLASFPDDVLSAALLREPHRLTIYARELATIFHNFYHKHRVLSDDPELSKARLLLCDCSRIVLRNVLKLLGISAPERM
ncbi:MAG: arginine--tRNA ligase [Candidatus Saganbacteria bacterium]|nr:arginine--tRNA ligase [Candidatus Saganbacteria bacterium]